MTLVTRLVIRAISRLKRDSNLSCTLHSTLVGPEEMHGPVSQTLEFGVDLYPLWCAHGNDHISNFGADHNEFCFESEILELHCLSWTLSDPANSLSSMWTPTSAFSVCRSWSHAIHSESCLSHRKWLTISCKIPRRSITSGCKVC